MPSRLVDHIYKEWKTLTNAPFVFLTVLVLSAIITFYFVNWYYEGIVQNANSINTLLNNRLTAKNDQLDEYRERLHISISSGSKYSKMTHKELKDYALTFVDKLREFLSETQRKSEAVSNKLWNKMVTAKTKEEKDKFWNTHTNALSQANFNQRAGYEKKFKVDAILLRDEILTRIPKDLNDKRATFMYENPVNYLVMKDVADSLERLAKQLK